MIDDGLVEEQDDFLRAVSADGCAIGHRAGCTGLITRSPSFFPAPLLHRDQLARLREIDARFKLCNYVDPDRKPALFQRIEATLRSR